MKLSNVARQHWAALRALLVLTVIVGLGYPLFIWLVAQIPGLSDRADGSMIEASGKPVGSSLIGQSFTDKDGNALPQYFQSRPSAAGAGYDPTATAASNLGPESIVDAEKPSLLTQVCARSLAVGEFEGVDGSRPYCTGDGVGAVLAVFRENGLTGPVTRVVSVNQTGTPFVGTYDGVPVQPAKAGEDYVAEGCIITPIRGDAPAHPAVPADAVTASGSGLDPDISPAYANLQAPRIARERGRTLDQVHALIKKYTDGRALGFMGEPGVNVLRLNLALDGRG